MATHGNPSPIPGHGTPSTPPGSSSMSVAVEVHHDTDVRLSNASTQQPGDFPNTGPATDYAAIPVDDRESPEEIDGSPSADSRATAGVHLDETEKSSLPYQPLDKLATLKKWTPEFVALFSSMAAFIIMVVLLVVSHEKPQPEWAYNVNINSLVAILTTLLRAAMLFILAETKWSWMATPRPLRHVERFDSASRGAWVSLKFLLFTCRPTPTALGALVVVASYATGPFSQQAVKTDRCEVSVRGVARISIAERVSNSDYTQHMDLLNPEMSVVAINGLLAIPPNNSQLFQCDSGNFEHTPPGNYWWAYRFHNNSQFGINIQPTPKLFSMTTTHYDYDRVCSSFLTFTVAGCTAQLNEEAQPNQHCEHDYGNMPKLRSDLGIVAANCTLYPCLRHYYGNVTNGTLNEHLLSTEPMRLSNRLKNYDEVEEGSTSVGTIRHLSLLDCDWRWWVGALYKGENATSEGLAAAHDNMATAITNHMRVNGLTWSRTNKSRSYKEGACHETVTCVRLQGLWLLYPAALLVLTSALLVTAYVQSCHDSGRQPIWKSAILPLLFYNISKEHNSDERNGDPDTGSSVPLLQLAELESLADKTIVTF
ncbi:hypothetical protein CSOJ01_03633 [Colletotrichum sojae]|uniref:Uncharacterized protein n=1 Tax=Colletotrichum sojae TaxID=2175907 RepID=A0A8H6JM03_9PEZI|nr:hypothetical protein CSOJ01_03633 [Colletotrichum sojae]